MGYCGLMTRRLRSRETRESEHWVWRGRFGFPSCVSFCMAPLPLPAASPRRHATVRAGIDRWAKSREKTCQLIVSRRERRFPQRAQPSGRGTSRSADEIDSASRRVGMIAGCGRLAPRYERL
jgi:hypothetical protein